MREEQHPSCRFTCIPQPKATASSQQPSPRSPSSVSSGSLALPLLIQAQAQQWFPVLLAPECCLQYSYSLSHLQKGLFMKIFSNYPICAGTLTGTKYNSAYFFLQQTYFEATRIGFNFSRFLVTFVNSGFHTHLPLPSLDYMQVK